MNDDVFIETKVNEIIKEYGITSAPVDLNFIAKQKELTLRPKPPELGTESGHLLRIGDDYCILYSQHINNIGFQRFSIAHEIGHFVLNGHVEAIFANCNEHASRSPYSSNDKYEREADKFASALLMPKSIFKQEMRRCKDGLEGIIALSRSFQTSLTATARRFAKLSGDNLIIIFSKDNIIEYFEMSDGFKEIKCEWPKPKKSVPNNTLTKDFDMSTEGYLEDEASMYDWFNTNEKYELKEQAIALGDTGQVLTIISCKEIEKDDETDMYSHYTRY